MVKVLFDTSVIVAALLPQHSSHLPCFSQLRAAESNHIQGYLSTHSLAEIYSVMTRMPSKPRLSPADVQRLLHHCLGYLNAIPLERSDYETAIAQMVTLNLPGGGIFDALIAQAALKISADQLLNLNPKHFKRLSISISQMVKIPE